MGCTAYLSRLDTGVFSFQFQLQTQFEKLEKRNRRRGEERPNSKQGTHHGHLHLASCTPDPRGLIRWGLDEDLVTGFVLRLRTGAALCEMRLTTGWGFQFEFKEERGVVSRVREFMEAIRCSRALREALVSRANLGVVFSGLETDGGVDRVGDSIGGVIRLWLSRERTDRGAPRPAGFFVNLLSVEAEVGRSSNDSSSVPSPKLRRLVGLVKVRFVVDPVVSVPESPRLNRRLSGREGRDSRENVPWGLRRSPELSELVRRDER